MSIVPAIDEAGGGIGETRFDLEYRRKGRKHWNLSHGGPLTTYRGKPSKRSIAAEKKVTSEDNTIWIWKGKRAVPVHPKLEFRIVRKDFVIKRRLIRERG